MTPRSFAHLLLDDCQRLAVSTNPSDRTTKMFLDLAEKRIKECLAFELRWLANYLSHRADVDDPPAPGGGGGTTAVRRG